jgi:hypothetical protein
MSKNTKATNLTLVEDTLIIEGLRKLALQRDTKVRLAEDEDEAEAYTADIFVIRHILSQLGDTKPLVLKSERKAKPKPKAKGKAKPKAVKITKAKVVKGENGHAEIHETLATA